MSKQQDFKRVFDILDFQRSQHPQKEALNIFEKGRWKATSSDTLQTQIEALSCHLIDMQLVKGDCVILMPKAGSPDWIKIDFACQQLGLIVVPIGATNNKDEIRHIYKEVDPKLCLVHDAGLYYKLSSIINKSIYRYLLFT